MYIRDDIYAMLKGGRKICFVVLGILLVLPVIHKSWEIIEIFLEKI